jgi:hypothetical protein
MPNDDIKDDVTEDQAQAEQAQDDLPEIEDAPSDDEEWTEEDMRLLSDEERAALFDDEENEGATDNDDADEGVSDAADEGSDQGEPAAQAASDDTAEDNADEDSDKGEQATGTQAPDMSAIDAEIEALKSAKVDVFDRYENGEISRDEYLAKLDEIAGVEKEAISQRAVAESQEKAVYEAFISAAKGYFGEYPDLATQSHAEAYDRHVRSITASPQYQHLTHRQMLEAAHRLYAAEAEVLGLEVPAPKGKEKPAPQADAQPHAQDNATQPPAQKKRPGDKAPVTLANVPNAAPVSVSDGKYSALAQRLESAGPEEYERIIASLSPDEAEAFASMDV